MGIRCKIYDNFVDGVEDAHQEDEKIALVSDEVTKEDDILVRGRQLSCFDTPAPIRGCSVEFSLSSISSSSCSLIILKTFLLNDP